MQSKALEGCVAHKSFLPSLTLVCFVVRATSIISVIIALLIFIVIVANAMRYRQLHVGILGHFCAISRMSSIFQHSPLLDIQCIEYFPVLPRRCRPSSCSMHVISEFWDGNLLLCYKVRSLTIPSMIIMCPSGLLATRLQGSLKYLMTSHYLAPFQASNSPFSIWPQYVSPLIKFFMDNNVLACGHVLITKFPFLVYYTL